MWGLLLWWWWLLLLATCCHRWQLRGGEMHGEGDAESGLRTDVWMYDGGNGGREGGGEEQGVLLSDMLENNGASMTGV